MTNTSHNSDNYCYRHPDRQSFVLCQRCGRTICAQCQTQAPVGVHCPECVREARGNAPKMRPQSVTRMRSFAQSGGPMATYTIMGLSALGFLVSFIPGFYATFAFAGFAAGQQPWRIVTGLFLHTNVLQILFNLYSIFIFGRMLETQLGKWRFAGLYLVAGLGGEAAVSLFAPTAGLAGGTAAIFGMFAAFFVIQRRLGNNAVQLLVILGLNLVIGLVLGAPWQAYLGGILMGAAVAYLLMETRERSQLNRQRLYVIGLAAVLVVVIVVRGVTLLSTF